MKLGVEVCPNVVVKCGDNHNVPKKILLMKQAGKTTGMFGVNSFNNITDNCTKY